MKQTNLTYTPEAPLVTGDIIQILGVDPAFSNWGMAVGTLNLASGTLLIQDLHLVQTAKTKVSGEKISRNDLRRAQQLSLAFRSRWERADLVCSEIPAGAQSAAAAKGLSIALGVLSSCSVPLIAVTPRDVKISGAGSHADKEAMIAWASTLHPEAPWIRRNLKGKSVIQKKNEHLADAIGAIYAGIHSPEFSEKFPDFDLDSFRNNYLEKPPTFGLSKPI